MKHLLTGLAVLMLTLPTATCTRSQPAKVHTLQDLAPTAAGTDTWWEFSTPEKEGLNPESLEGMLTAIDKAGYEIHSLTIVKNGKIVMDAYGTDWRYDRPRTPEDLHDLHSVTKSVTAILLGVASDQGVIPDFSAPALEWFDRDRIKNPGSGKEEITLADLLTMRSGLLWSEGPHDHLFFDGPCSAETILSQPMENAPGTVWIYSSGNSQILAEILRRATGHKPEQFAEKYLFSPLGITKWQWQADKSGTHFGGWGLRLRPRDMARIGLMCLQDGYFDGQRILTSGRIGELTADRSEPPWNRGRYGYHWWLPWPGGFAARGYKGQEILVLPQENIVVVFTAELPPEQADGILDSLVSDYILPAAR